MCNAMFVPCFCVKYCVDADFMLNSHKPGAQFTQYFECHIGVKPASIQHRHSILHIHVLPLQRQKCQQIKKI